MTTHTTEININDDDYTVEYEFEQGQKADFDRWQAPSPDHVWIKSVTNTEGVECFEKMTGRDLFEIEDKIKTKHN